MFKKLSKYKNLFLEEDTMELYQLLDGEMKPIEDGVLVLKQDYDFDDILIENNDDFSDPFAERLKLMDEKVENGEISCNLDNPEDCINCGS